MAQLSNGDGRQWLRVGALQLLPGGLVDWRLSHGLASFSSWRHLLPRAEYVVCPFKSRHVGVHQYGSKAQYKRTPYPLLVSYVYTV